MKFRNLLIILMSTVFFIFLAACSSDTSNQPAENNNSDSTKEEEREPITLKVASYFGDVSTSYVYSVKPWMDQVTEKTNGMVQFEYYPSEQLGKAADLLRLTGDKVADISMMPTIYNPSEMPYTVAMTSLPGLVETADQGSMAFYELLQQNSELLEQDYLKNGVRPLLAQMSPPYQIWAKNKEIRSPEDLKGLKIKTAGGISSEFFESVGSVPVAVAFPELYEAIDKGVIDAISLDGNPLDTAGVTDVIKHGVITNYGTSLVALVINEEVWQSLPEEVQTIMAEAGKEITAQVGKSYDKLNDEFLEKYSDSIEIADLSTEEQDKWVQTGERFQDDWIKENEKDGMKYSDMLSQYKEILVKYQ